ncbi:MAG: hypothetical protein AB1634_08360 [Thermodesulfobacteriota bacterium]
MGDEDEASAVGRGNQLIYDADLNITWYDYSNPYYVNGQYVGRWQDQMNWASNLSVTVNGVTYDDWRLPSTVDGPYVWGYDGSTTAGYNITTSEMGHLYYTELSNKGYYDTSGNAPQPGWGSQNVGPFQHLTSYWYWPGTEYASYPANAWYFSLGYGNQGAEYKGYDGYGLAVRPGDVAAPVPLPATALLLGTGMAGLLGWKRGRRGGGAGE